MRRRSIDYEGLVEDGSITEEYAVEDESGREAFFDSVAEWIEPYWGTHDCNIDVITPHGRRLLGTE